MTAYLTIKEAREALEAGSITARQLVQSHLDQIDKVDDAYKIVVSRMDERALEQADSIDARRNSGEELGPLAGIPFTAKDMFLIEGTQTTAASQILKDFIAPYSSTAITKLEAAGAICIAKVNQDEFGHGASTENSSFVTTRNPHDVERVAGGSSGGSAAAVAARIGIFSVGTDTGGSSRQPAAFCGVVGMKPTYGLISRYGVIAMASSLDTIGTLGNSVDDVSLVCSIMAGQDAHDATTIKLDNYDFSKRQTKPPRAAVIKQYMENLEPEIKYSYEQAFEKLRQAGWEIGEVSLDTVSSALPAYYILTPAEISSNLERYDGIRYGSSDDAPDLTSVYRHTRGKYFGPEAIRRILTGTYVLSAGYYDAYYKKAMQVRTIVRKEFDTAFKKFDIIIGPTAPTVAFKVGENSNDPIAMYLADIMTVAANLAGVPSISIPLNGPHDLPLGLQLMSAQKNDAGLFSAAERAETDLATKLKEITL
ncbi:MAG: Asp-tRNA(Asn)/Glu-tRNA(Gln) amidotransferase subunit GatA [bacterium]